MTMGRVGGAKPRSVLFLAALALTTLLASQSRAEPYVSARIGYSAPLGSTFHSSPMTSAATGAIPLSLSLGGTLSRMIILMAHVEIAPLLRDCGTLAGCGGWDVHPGFALHAIALERGPVALWAEVGVGAEILNASSSGGAVSATTTLLGVEPLRLAIGGDYRFSNSRSLGLWLGLASGIFSASFTNVQGLEVDTAIHERALHHWLSIGLSVGFGR